MSNISSFPMPDDRAFVLRLHDVLREKDYETWVDWEDIPPSAEWMKEIEQGISSADIFLFIVSPVSVNSVICAKEAAFAAQHNKKIIPIVCQETDPTYAPSPIEERQWILSRTDDEFQGAIEQLLKAIDTDLEWVRKHTRFLGRALEWEAAGRERSYLLQGQDLEDGETWLGSGEGREIRPTALQTAFIIASRSAATQRQRVILGSVAAALLVSVVLAIWAVFERDAKEFQRVAAVSEAWNARLNAAGALYEQSFVLSENGRMQGASAVLLRALELAPMGGAPEGFRTSWAAPGWAESAWNRYRYLDSQRGKLHERLAGHISPITCIAISSDGRQALTGSFDHTIILWDLQHFEIIKVFEGHQGAIAALAFSPDGRQALSSSLDGLLYSWDLEKQTGDALFPAASEPVTSLAIASDGKIAFGLQSGYVAVLGKDGAPLLHRRMHAASITALAFDEKGETLFTGSGRPTIGGSIADHGVMMWEFATGQQRLRVPGTLDSSVSSIAIDPHGMKALRGMDNGIVELWDLDTGKLLHSLTGHMAAIWSLAFTPDGHTAVSGSEDDTIRVWDVATGKLLRVLDGHLESVSSLAFSPDGSILLSKSVDTTVAVWNMTPLNEQIILEETGSVGAVTIAPG
jgi:hypothetical protein